MDSTPDYNQPPRLENEDSYMLWKKAILLWSIVSDIPKEKQAIAVTLSLRGKARKAALEVNTDDLNSDDGIEILLKKLDDILSTDPMTIYEAFRAFDSVKRQQFETFNTYAKKFIDLYARLKEVGVAFSEKLLTLKLLSGAQLSASQAEDILRRTEDGSLESAIMNLVCYVDVQTVFAFKPEGAEYSVRSTDVVATTETNAKTSMSGVGKILKEKEKNIQLIGQANKKLEADVKAEAHETSQHDIGPHFEPPVNLPEVKTTGYGDSSVSQQPGINYPPHIRFPDQKKDQSGPSPGWNFKFHTLEEMDQANKKLEAEEKAEEHETSQHDTGPHFEPLVNLPEVEVRTGEEEENIMFSERAKLFRWHEGQWKERGVGDMKILKHRKTGKHRLLMRRDQVLKICCNHLIGKDLNLKPMPRSDKAWMWHAMDFSDEEGSQEGFAIRFKTVEMANDFRKKFLEGKEENMKVVAGTPVRPSPKQHKSTHSMTASGMRDFAPSTELLPSVSETALPKIKFSFPKPSAAALDLAAKISGNQIQQMVEAKQPEIDKDDDNRDESVHNESGDGPHFEPVIKLPDRVSVVTGEENEEVLFCQRVKLYRYHDKQWKERGVGDMKILHNKANNKCRIVMRRDQVLKLCANHYITPEMKISRHGNQDKSLTWTALDHSDSDVPPRLELLATRFKDVETAVKFREVFNQTKDIIQGKVPPSSTATEISASSTGIFKPLTPSTSTTTSPSVQQKIQSPKGTFVAQKIAGSWDCPACYSPNLASDKKCPCCDTPNPTAPKMGSSAFSFGRSQSNNSEKSAFGTGQQKTANVNFGSNVTSQSNNSKNITFGIGQQQTSNVFLKLSQHDEHSTGKELPKPRFPSIWEEADDSDEYTDDDSSYETSEYDDEDEEYEQQLASNRSEFLSPLNRQPEVSSPDNDNVVYVGEILPSEELQKKAENLMLPKHFYNFVKEGEDCGSQETGDEQTITSDKRSMDNKVASSNETIGTTTTSSTFGFASAAGASFAYIAKTNTKSGFAFGATNTGWVGMSKQKPLFANLTETETNSSQDEDEYYQTEDNNDIHFEPIANLPEKVDLVTGEEGEETLYSDRCKLYRFNKPTNEWKERGVGDIKLQKNVKTGRIRIVMRREQVLKVCANHYIRPGMSLEGSKTSDRAWTWTALDFTEEEPQMEVFTARFKNSEAAKAFKEKFDLCQMMLLDADPMTPCKASILTNQTDI